MNSRELSDIKVIMNFMHNIFLHVTEPLSKKRNHYFICIKNATVISSLQGITITSFLYSTIASSL